jgi:hypothetical protein
MWSRLISGVVETMMNPRERSMIIQALEVWANSVPDEPLIGFVDGSSLMTPSQLVREVRENTDQGAAVLEILEHGMRREGIEAVIRRLSAVSTSNSGEAFA